MPRIWAQPTVSTATRVPVEPAPRRLVGTARRVGAEPNRDVRLSLHLGNGSRHLSELCWRQLRTMGLFDALQAELVALSGGLFGHA